MKFNHIQAHQDGYTIHGIEAGRAWVIDAATLPLAKRQARLQTKATRLHQAEFIRGQLAYRNRTGLEPNASKAFTKGYLFETQEAQAKRDFAYYRDEDYQTENADFMRSEWGDEYDY